VDKEQCARVRPAAKAGRCARSALASSGAKAALAAAASGAAGVAAAWGGGEQGRAAPSSTREGAAARRGRKERERRKRKGKKEKKRKGERKEREKERGKGRSRRRQRPDEHARLSATRSTLRGMRKEKDGTAIEIECRDGEKFREGIRRISGLGMIELNDEKVLKIIFSA